MINPVVGTLLFACVGIAIEVMLTGIASYKKSKDTKLKGYSYVWMLPIYALAYPALSLLYPVVGSWNFILRGLIYVCMFFFVEYISGWILRLSLGKCPWEEQYKGKRWSVSNLIRLDYAPGWFVVAFIFEFLYRSFH